MDPVTLSILAGSGAATGFFDHQAQVKKDKAQMMANAAQIEYSPWTGMKSQVQGPQANSLFGDMAKGALGFGMMGSQFGQGAAGNAADADIAQAKANANTSFGANQPTSQYSLMQQQQQPRYSLYGR